MKKTISYLAGAIGLCALLFVASCSDDDNGGLPPIDGYNNSNEVASDNLVAHWTFDGTNEEDISGTGPLAGAAGTFGTVGFEAGQIGQALKLTEGVLVYPTIANINSANALSNFTVSLWVKVSNNKGTANEGFTSFFGLVPTGVTDIWPNISANAETSWYVPASDTLSLKNSLNSNPVGGGNILQDNLATINNNDPENPVGSFFKGANRWAHYVMVWNSTENKYYLFADGVDVGGYTQRSATGALTMAVPVQAVFGSLASSDIGFENAPEQQGWNPWATASIDDVRVFNTTLSQVEIMALYNLGSAGR